MTATELAQAPAPASNRSSRWLRPFGTLLAAQLVAGLLIGVLWRLWAPSSVSYLLSNDTGGSVVIPDESEAQIAGDGRFVLLSVLAGLLFGLFAWTLRRYRGPAMAAVLTAGSLLGSVLAMATGRLLSGGTGSPTLNTAFHPRLTLHSSAALFVQAFIAVLVYTVLAGLSRDPELGLAAETWPAANQPGQPDGRLDQPAGLRDQPGQPDWLSGRPPAVKSDLNPAAGRPNPATGHSDPAAGDRDPAAGHSGPAGGDQDPVAGDPTAS